MAACDAETVEYVAAAWRVLNALGMTNASGLERIAMRGTTLVGDVEWRERVGVSSEKAEKA